MANCPQCHETLPLKARFCPGCGRPVVDAASTVLGGKARPASLPPRVLSAGTQLGRAYTIEGVVGEGGMGVVYRATDQVRQ